MIMVESEDAYHANPALGRSQLWKLIRKTPAHLRYADQTIETKAQAIGTAAHIAILQPEELERRVLVGPDVNKNTKEWKAVKESAEASRRTLVDPREWDVIRRMRDNAMKHALVRRLVDGSKIERSLYWDHDGIPLKARPDAYNQSLGLIADIKTAASAAPRDFAKSVASYGYHLQEYMYTKALKANGLKAEGFVFIVIEKEDPYLVALYELDPHVFAEAERVFEAALEKYRECSALDSWPGYTPEGPQTLMLPAWAFTQSEFDAYEQEAS